jgi:eukaryotic-like serine/threonine-protein kinase
MAAATCPFCGAELKAEVLGGLCPKCVLGRAMVEPEIDLETSEGGGRRSDARGPGLAAGDQAAAQTASVVVPSSEQSGDRIGRYKLLQHLGQGGMGSVWMAEQTEPVRRMVALKVIKPGMDSAEVLARFEAERQALALMDHPNIARVLDAGATPNGRPYFVMDLVKGIPLIRFCDEQRLSVRERLELFIQVCRAVQHAHQKGIIHRDLKPGNVLVALYDGQPVPKVIDFGVAKAMGQRLTERTLFTELGSVIGTLEYMSPEQAEFNQLDIDTRSDIYSLGVLLYELLTGTTPLSRETVRQAAFDEVLKRIREEEPPNPSLRLSTSRERLPAISAQRKLEPEKLTKAVRGELDWIVMKALEKERNRRYDTASGLALDLQHHLKDEPVGAGPPTMRYRAKKFVRKHRREVAFAGGLLLVGVAGFCGVLMEWHRANRNAVASHDQVIRLNIANGNRLLREGEPSGAAAWFAEALSLDQSRPEKEETHRVRLESLLDQGPKLLWMGFHPGPLETAKLSPDGRWVAAAGANTMLVWETDTGRAVTPPLQLSGKVYNLSFSRDSRRIATAERDRAQIWNVESGKSELTLAPVRPLDAVFSPDGRWVATASGAGSIQIWDATTGRTNGLPLQHATKPEFFQNRSHLAFSPDSSRLLSATYDSTAKVWDVGTGKLLTTLRHALPVRHAEFSPDGAVIATACFKGTAHLWSAATGEPLVPALRHPGIVDHVTFSADGQWLASVGEHGCVRLWNVTNGLLERTLSDTSGMVLESNFSPDGGWLAARRYDGRVQVWSLREPKLTCTTLRLGRFALAAQFHRDGQRLLTADASGNVRLWCMTPETSQFVPWPEPDKTILGASPKGTHLVTCDAANALQVWETDTWRPTGPSLAFTSTVTVARFGMDDRRMLTMERVPSGAGRNDDGLRFRTWNLTTGKPLGNLVFSPTATTPKPGWFGLHPDCTRVAVSFDQMVEGWNLESCERLWRSGPYDLRTGVLRYSPDGRRLAIVSGRAVHLLEAESGQEVCRPLTNRLPAILAEFSPDGASLVTTCADSSYDNGQARLWETATGRLCAALPHNDGVYCAAFSRDGRRLATGGESRVARVFELPGGQAITPDMRHESKIYAVAFSPDGRWLATGSGDRTARVWDGVTGEAITAPLLHPEMVTAVAFLAGGNALITRSGGAFRLWQLKPKPRPREDLIELGRLTAAHRLDPTGVLEPLAPVAQSNAWNRLKTMRPDQFLFRPKPVPRVADQ